MYHLFPLLCPLLSSPLCLLKLNSSFQYFPLSLTETHEIRKEPQQPDRENPAGVARQVPLLQGTQEEAQTIRPSRCRRLPPRKTPQA